MIHKLSKIVQIIFRHISVERLLDPRPEKRISYESIDSNYLHDLMLTYYKAFTDTEIELQLREVHLQINRQLHKYSDGQFDKRPNNHLNAFEVLFEYIPQVLDYSQNKVVCKYQKLAEWNELVRATGEDLPVVTMKVHQYFEQGTECKNFSWKPIIGHNNTQLDRILSRGIADNHFHLRGSSSYFDISWINLMNYPAKGEFKERFAEIEKQRRDKNKKAELQLPALSYWVINIQAALIRLYLYSRLTHMEIKLTEYHINTRTILTYINKYESFRGFSEAVSDIVNSKSEYSLSSFIEECEQRAGCMQDYPYLMKFLKIFRFENITIQNNYPKEPLDAVINAIVCKKSVTPLDLWRDLLPPEAFKECWHIATFSALEKMLFNTDLLEINLADIQKVISGLSLDKNAEDYILTFLSGSIRRDEMEYKILSGERWFLYHMTENLLRKDSEFTPKEKNLFFVYIRIKNDIRGELIQSNDLVGFQNFQIYQKRKDFFSRVRSLPEEEGKIARLAVQDVLNNKAVRYLEVRISPADTVEQNLMDIYGYDDAITKPYNKDDLNIYEIRKAQHSYENYPDIIGYPADDLKKRFYYVYHFTKQEDKLSSDKIEHQCRHYQYRKKIRRKAYAIMELRKKYPIYGQRILGIDACSMEVGCRPEVFGCVFRELKYHSCLNSDSFYDIELPQLRITYHAGEEFLDIVDGLRAVDEAVRFLGMDCGDRIGHALVLGIDAAKWYAYKGMQVSVTLQDYLDNIVWMHHALIKYRIKDMSSLKGWLEEKYALYFNYIYLYSESDNCDEGYIRGKYDINSYYLSWLLRGDDPDLYHVKKGTVKYKKPELMDFYSVTKKQQRKDDIRNIPEVIALYYMYHYNSGAKKRGREIKTFSIQDKYIKGIIEIQKALREEIVQKGISIETNPTSNVNISVMKGYEEHPIKTLYNLGLTANEKEITECPQMNVSINTDDKGIFSTRIENEYAMLASALETVMSPEQKPLYKRECIYSWLDNIREMGLRQAFGNDGK